MNCWRSPLSWSLIFCKTYKFLCNMWYVMCDAWCVMFQTWFFVRSWLYESRGDQKHPIWVISDLFNDIPKLISGGSRMHTISCKASYSDFFNNLLDWKEYVYLAICSLRDRRPYSRIVKDCLCPNLFFFSLFFLLFQADMDKVFHRVTAGELLNKVQIAQKIYWR